MFRMMLNAGCSCRKVSTYSQASQTMVSLLPTRPLPPMKGSLPPMTALGSRPASIRICVSMPVVVVLPCVPETAMEFENFFVSRPSTTERSSVGTPFSRAATSSGLSCFAAAV